MKYSVTSALWLSYVDKYCRRHGNGDEYQVDQYKLDGYDEQNKIAWEFNGCLYHGCPMCYPERSFKHKGETMYHRFRKTYERAFFLESKGYKVRMVWEHQWEAAIAIISIMQKLFLDRKYKGLPRLIKRMPMSEGPEAALESKKLVCGKFLDGKNPAFNQLTTTRPRVTVDFKGGVIVLFQHILDTVAVCERSIMIKLYEHSEIVYAMLKDTHLQEKIEGWDFRVYWNEDGVIRGWSYMDAISFLMRKGMLEKVDIVERSSEVYKNSEGKWRYKLGALKLIA